MDEMDTLPEDEHKAELFAGRAALYARLQQHILDPPERQAIIYTGHDGIGKTALLQHFSSVFDDPLLSIYVPLAEIDLSDEDSWLHYLVAAINQLLDEHNFSLSRVPHLVTESAEREPPALKDWLRDTYLSEVLQIIRPHRHIVFLLDDAEHLLKFGADHWQYLHELLQQHAQLAIVLTLDTEHEDKLNQLIPLVDPTAAERIQRLSLEESADLIEQFVSQIDEASIEKIYRATGGQPRLLTGYGYDLRERRQQLTDLQTLEQARTAVYSTNLDTFRAIWLRLSRDERLVLTAIASLIYENPLGSVSASDIERWLIETDYPMDIVAISAALRSLDYRDIVSQQHNQGARLVMGLMQQWLLENARLDEAQDTNRGTVPILIGVIVVVLILFLISLFIILPKPIIENSDDLATATLSR